MPNNPIDSFIDFVQRLSGPTFSGDARQQWAALIDQAEGLGIDASELLFWLRTCKEDAVIPPEMHEAMRRVGGRLLAKQGAIAPLIAADEYSKQKAAGEDPAFPEWAFRRNQELQSAREPAGSVRLGNFRYRDREGNVIVLAEAQDHVLRSLMLLPHSSGSKAELIKQSGKEDAARVLAKIREKYPGLRDDIKLPEKKGQGGYSTSIRDGRKDV